MYKSKKQLEQETLENINKNYLSLSQIDDRQLLKKSQIDKYIKSKELKSIKFKNKVYIQRQSLFEVMEGMAK